MDFSQVKMICFGARVSEQPFFHSLNRHGFALTLIPELLTADNIAQIAGHEAVLLRGNCPAHQPQLEQMKALGVKYLLTRTVGFDHIDVPAAKALGFVVARVPGYSPNAISELAITLAMMLVRNTAATVAATSSGDYRVHPGYFSKEIRHIKVGILGLGRIGLTTATLLKGLGVTQLLGYDPYISDAATATLTMTDMESVISQSELLFLHMPYIKDQNHHLVNAAFLQKMPAGSILVNAARGELMNSAAVLAALQSHHLHALATDVLEKEATLFNHNFTGQSSGNQVFDALQALYPRVLLTPHIGSNTEEACRNMIEQSFDNLHDYLTTGSCKNAL